MNLLAIRKKTTNFYRNLLFLPLTQGRNGLKTVGPRLG